MDNEFGHWLAGFTDGEGAFVICRVSSRNGNPHHRTWPNCRFEINLRADDAAILRTIQEQLGFGSIVIHMRPNPTRPNEQGSLRFVVHRIADCLRLVELFQRFPLRAKKHVQFSVWADAVHEMAKGPERSDSCIEEARTKLAQLRQYVAPTDVSSFTAGNPPSLKHRKEYGIRPQCLCGCGGDTNIFASSLSRTHPNNPNYSAFLRGHNKRLVASYQPKD